MDYYLKKFASSLEHILKPMNKIRQQHKAYAGKNGVEWVCNVRRMRKKKMGAERETERVSTVHFSFISMLMDDSHINQLYWIQFNNGIHWNEIISNIVVDVKLPGPQFHIHDMKMKMKMIRDHWNRTKKEQPNINEYIVVVVVVANGFFIFIFCQFYSFVDLVLVGKFI